MAILDLFKDDFETEDLSKWDLVDNPSNFDVNAGAKYTGSFGLDADLENISQSQLGKNITAGHTIYVLDWWNRFHEVELYPRGCFKLLKGTAGSTYYGGMVIRNIGGTWKIKVEYLDGSEQWVGTEEVVSPNTWYHFRIIVGLSVTGAGYAKFYKDDMVTPFYEVSDLDNDDSGDPLNQIYMLFQCGLGHKIEEDFDDFWCYTFVYPPATTPYSLDVILKPLCHDAELSNTDGYYLCVPLLNISSRESSKPARRDVPKREEGEVIDTGTWKISIMTLTVTTRLSDSEKTTLKTIIDGNKEIKLVAEGWTYLGWLTSKSIIYEYRVFNGELRPWRTKLTFDIYSATYSE